MTSSVFLIFVKQAKCLGERGTLWLIENELRGFVANGSSVIGEQRERNAQGFRVRHARQLREAPRP